MDEPWWKSCWRTLPRLGVIIGDGVGRGVDYLTVKRRYFLHLFVCTEYCRLKFFLLQPALPLCLVEHVDNVPFLVLRNLRMPYIKQQQDTLSRAVMVDVVLIDILINNLK